MASYVSSRCTVRSPSNSCRDRKASNSVANDITQECAASKSHCPNQKFLNGTGIELEAIGLIKTHDDLMTNIKGVFAAGDVRHGATMQIASATGEGATVALRIREYLEGHKVINE